MPDYDTSHLSQFKSKWTDAGSQVGVISVAIKTVWRSTDYEVSVLFDAYKSLPHDLIWDLIYVGSPSDSSFDQKLCSVNYGAAEKGEHKFLMEAPPPDEQKVPIDKLIGTTKIILKAKYNGQEFLTLGWPVTVKSPAANVDELLELPLSTPVRQKLCLTRRINIDQCTVTAHEIVWDDRKDFDMENIQS